MVNFHDMIVVLNGLAEHQTYVSRSFDQFKIDILNTLKQISDDNIIIKQELFILRQQNHSGSNLNESSTVKAPKVVKPPQPQKPKVAMP
jgi:hypothetical protein